MPAYFIIFFIMGFLILIVRQVMVINRKNHNDEVNNEESKNKDEVVKTDLTKIIGSEIVERIDSAFSHQKISLENQVALSQKDRDNDELNLKPASKFILNSF